MPRGIFHVVAIAGDKVLYSSAKPKIGELDTIEKRAFAQALRSHPDVEPENIEIYVQPFVSVQYVRNPPAQRPHVEQTQDRKIVDRKAQAANARATQGVVPRFYKPNNE